VNADHLLARHGEQPERIARAQIVLLHEGETLEIRQRPEVVRVNAGALALAP